MQRHTQVGLATSGAVIAALVPALVGAGRALPVSPVGVSTGMQSVGAVVSGVAAAVAILAGARRGDRVRTAVALSALSLALSWFVPGLLVVVFVSVAQAALLAAGVLARRAHGTAGQQHAGQRLLGLVLAVLAALWFVALLATSNVPIWSGSQAVLLTWFAAPDVFQAAAYLVAVVLVARPLWTVLGRGVRYLRESAEVR